MASLLESLNQWADLQRLQHWILLPELKGNAKESLEPYFYKPNIADGDDHGNYESLWARVELK